MADAGSWANDRVSSVSRAHASLAGVGRGAKAVISVASHAVSLGRLRAEARGGRAGTDRVALILSRADNRVAADAGAASAHIGLGATVAVGAGRAVSLGRIRADTGRAGTHIVALVQSRAHDRGGDARAS